MYIYLVYTYSIHIYYTTTQMLLFVFSFSRSLVIIGKIIETYTQPKLLLWPARTPVSMHGWERETDRQTDRDRDRETERERNRETERERRRRSEKDKTHRLRDLVFSNKLYEMMILCRVHDSHYGDGVWNCCWSNHAAGDGWHYVITSMLALPECQSDSTRTIQCNATARIV